MVDVDETFRRRMHLCEQAQSSLLERKDLLL